MNITADKLIEISKLSDIVPEKYQVECFGILLEHELYGKVARQPDGNEDKKTDDNKDKIINKDFKVPIPVSALLNQYSLPEDKVLNLFHIQDGEITPIYKLKDISSTRKAQIESTLLLSFENALRDGKFGFNINHLRKKLEDEKIYDSKNFKTYLSKAGDFFNNLDKDDVLLTVDGKAELANILTDHIK